MYAITRLPNADIKVARLAFQAACADYNAAIEKVTTFEPWGNGVIAAMHRMNDCAARYRTSCGLVVTFEHSRQRVQS